MPDMTGPNTSLDEIRSLEEALHNSETRQSRAALEALLMEGFIEVGSSGAIYHRSEMIDLLVQEERGADREELRADDYRLMPISADAVLLTYRTLRTGSDGATRFVLRSSIWIQADGRWQMLFHQGTATTPLKSDVTV